MQTFHNRGSECIVTRHAPLLIRDPYTRKQSVLGYMFVGSVFVLVQRTLFETWPRFFKKHPMKAVAKNLFDSRDSSLIEIHCENVYIY